jgi:hypothetical protein
MKLFIDPGNLKEIERFVPLGILTDLGPAKFLQDRKAQVARV